jgi:hypothetical protein
VGRKLILISAAIALSIFVSVASFAQGPHQKSSRRGGSRHQNKEFRGARERLFQLSPEERQTFKRNAERWLQMSPEQQNILRERERARRVQMKKEAEAALRESGLRFDPREQDVFESRYVQERRRIEQALRKEVETKRQQQLRELNERLKHEFQSPQSSPTVSPGSSGPVKPRQ